LALPEAVAFAGKGHSGEIELRIHIMKEQQGIVSCGNPGAISWEPNLTG
jgi:hypothetical protein